MKYEPRLVLWGLRITAFGWVALLTAIGVLLVKEGLKRRGAVPGDRPA
jgi:hypothetical protein